MTNHPNPNSAAQAATNNTAQRVLTDDEIMRSAISACDSLNITRFHEIGAPSKTIMDDAGLLELGRAIESALLSKLRAPVADERAAISGVTLDGCLETLFCVGEHLGINYAESRKQPGAPSGVYIKAIEDRVSRASNAAREEAAKLMEQTSRSSGAALIRTLASAPVVDETALQAWADRFPEISDMGRLRDAWNEARASAPVAAQPGWKLVPIAPTPEMEDAGCHVPCAQDDAPAPSTVYAAMIGAAPPAPDGSATVAGEAQPVAWLHQCRKKPELAQLTMKKHEPALAAKGYRPMPLYAAPQASAEDVRNAAPEEAATFLENNRTAWQSVRAAYEIRALKQPQADKDGAVDKSRNLQGNPVDRSADLQGDKDGGQQRAGDKCAHARAYHAVDRQGYACPDCGEFVSEYEVHRRRQRAALSAAQTEQGERDAK